MVYHPDILNKWARDESRATSPKLLVFSFRFPVGRTVLREIGSSLGEESVNGLNDRESAFVSAFAVSRDGQAAAVAAGYAPGRAQSTARRLLRNPAIVAALAERDKEKPADDTGKPGARSRSGINRILEEYASIAFADIRDYLSFGADGVRVVSSEDLDEFAARAIAEVHEVRNASGVSVKIKLHDKRAALDSLARHYGLFVDRKELTIDAGTLAKLTPEQLERLADEIERLDDQPG